MRIFFRDIMVGEEKGFSLRGKSDILERFYKVLIILIFFMSLDKDELL